MNQQHNHKTSQIRDTYKAYTAPYIITNRTLKRTFTIIICPQHNDNILEQRKKSKSPKDHRKRPKCNILSRIFLHVLREYTSIHIKRGNAQVSKNQAQTLIHQEEATPSASSLDLLNHINK